MPADLEGRVADDLPAWSVVLNVLFESLLMPSKWLRKYL
jgi:hypothetical protein